MTLSTTSPGDEREALIDAWSMEEHGFPDQVWFSRKEVLAILASFGTRPAAEPVRIDFRQATELLEMFGGQPAELTLEVVADRKDGLMPGLYAWHTDYPEEGSVNLGVTDAEAVPAAEPSAGEAEDNALPAWMNNAINHRAPAAPAEAARDLVLRGVVNMLEKFPDEIVSKELFNALEAARHDLEAAPTPAEPACKGAPGECEYNGACMYACGAEPKGETS